MKVNQLALLALSVLLLLSPQVSAQPVASLEGFWQGTCQRGGKSLNVGLVMDQLGARLNEKPVTNLQKAPFAISLQEGKKTFRGTFTNNTMNLNATLTADGKEASCTLTRKVNSSDRLCIRNLDQPVIFVRLENGPSSTMRLFKGSEIRITTGDPQGKLCWDTADFNGCPRSLPQSTYAC